MDPAVIETLRLAGIETDFARVVPIVGIAIDADGEILPVGDEVAVLCGKKTALVRLRAAGELFTGDAVPPDFSVEPPPAYVHFFALIEMTAADICSQGGRVPTDKEFEEMYEGLRRRPDGTDAEPIVSYMRAAARLYMSLRDVSRAEYEGVVRRLARSARRFAMGYTSRNYEEIALRPLLGVGRRDR